MLPVRSGASPLHPTPPSAARLKQALGSHKHDNDKKMNITIFIFLLFYPAIALANAGIPMLMLLWPFSILTLIPVILIETYVIEKHLKLGIRATIKHTTKANLISTFFGVPLVWVLSFIAELIIMFSIISIFDLKSYPSPAMYNLSEPAQSILITVLTFPWLGGANGNIWIIQLALTLLLTLCFFASYLIERSYFIIKLPKIKKKKISTSIKIAHIYSYLFLLIVSFMLHLAN